MRTSRLVGLVALVALSLPLLALPTHAALPSVGLRGCAQQVLAAPTRNPHGDRSAWRDRCGRAFYVDETQAEATVALDAPASTLARTSDVPLDQAFLLHSRPGSTRVIYLDVNGHLLSGTGWNDSYTGGANLTAAPYDTDGAPATFSAAERTAVISIFQRVAEDYAPFDVDVTTADPGQEAITRTGAADLRFGTRAVITGSTLACGGCAGMGYIGAFDSTWEHAYTQPALAFSGAVGHDPKLLADIVSHEVGHGFDLEHDGSATSSYSAGQAAWAPIMGAATRRPLSQFSNGDYAGATNQQDDLALIATHGAPLLADDHGGTAATASPISTTAQGVLGNRTDVDWFRFATTGGGTTASVSPVAVGANLDLKLDLLGADGAVRATSAPAVSPTTLDPPTGLGAFLAVADLPAGTWYLRVEGTGDPTGGYSDYGSVGRFTLQVATSLALTPVVAVLPEATVGRVFSTGLPAVGGSAPYTWSLSGTLPAGLALSPAGVLSGTPLTAGSSSFSTTVTDGQTTATVARTLVVRVPPVVTTAALPAATRGRPYATQLSGAGGLAPYTWRVAAGTLAAGLTVSSTGRVSGTPTTAGTLGVAFLLTDPAGRKASRWFSLRVNPPPVITTASLPGGLLGRAYGTRLAASGGTPTLGWRLVAGTLPTGLRLSSTGLLSGTPTVRASRSLTFQVTDARGALSRRALTLRIG